MYPDLEPMKDYVIMDNGNGAFIKEWNAEGIKKPIKKELLAKADEFQTKLDNALAIQHRIKEYPHIGDQLDAIVKQLNYMQMNGQVDLIADMDDIVGQCMAVKRKHKIVKE